MEHIVTDCESNRTFCLTVNNGVLVNLQEQVPCLRYPHTETRWGQVDKLSTDGADWWEQWEGEVKAGEFGVDDKVEEAHFTRQQRLALLQEY